MFYIISQVLIFCALVIDLVGKCLKSKKQILTCSIIAAMFYVSSYLFLFTWLGAIANALNLIRMLWYILLDERHCSYRYYLIPMIVTSVIFIGSLIIFWNGPADLFLLYAALVYAVGFSFRNDLITRITIILASIGWLIFNFTLHAYVNMFCDITGMVIAFIGIIVYNILPYKKNKKQSELQGDEVNIKDAIFDNINSN